MLAVPVKKSKNVDWGVPLRSYIAKTYGEQVADEQTESLSSLNQTRDWVLANSKKADDEGLEKIKSYLRMLGAVEARFPIRETHVNITFTWYDSFKPAKKFMHHRVEAERAAIIFNFAAMNSYAGMIQDRSQQEGNQQAVNYFLTAARYFQYLRDVYIPSKIEGPVTSDLSQEGLTMLTNLMLAQSQVCIFEKALRGKMSSGVLSKIAAGAKQFYQDALLAAASPNLSEIIDKSWSDHMNFQMKCLEASSIFHYSRILFKTAEETGEGYGKRIAYLTQAKGYCDNLLQKRDTLLDPQVATVNGLRETINKELTKAVADNNSIYMDLIPELSSLESPPAHVLAKVELDKIDQNLVGPILPGTSTENLSGGELFAGLLPAEVQLAVAMFDSRVSGLVEKATKFVNEKEKHVKEALAGANLPGAIEAGGGRRGVPDAMWAKILEKVHQQGGVNGLKSILLSNGKLADQLNAIIFESSQKLTVEEATDLRHRQVWGPRWTLATSTEANQFLKKDLARFKGLLTEATESDKALLAKIDSVALSSVLEDVSKDKPALDNLMPDPGKVDDDAEVESLRAKLRMSYINLQNHLQTVASKLAEFIYETSKANIVNDLYKKDRPVGDVVSNEAELNSIIENKVDKFEAPVSELEKLTNENTTLLSRVLTDNSNYLAARRENAATKETEQALQRLEFGIQKFTEIHTHISEGKKFYASLAEKVQTLRTNVVNHCATREMLTKELESMLTQGGGAAGGFNQPLTTQMVTPMAATNYGMMQNNNAAFANSQPQPTQNTPSFFANNNQQPVTTVPVVPVVANPAPSQQPAPQSGLSLFEQMKQAQLEAEAQGTLGNFAGTDNTSPSPAPAPGPADDMQAAQTALALEQQEILAAIQTRNAIKESKRTDYTKELNEVKNIVGNEYPDKLIMKHLKVNQGNVPLTVSNLFDNIPPKSNKKKGGGFFGRRKKKKDAGAPIAAGGNANTGGGNVW